MPKIDTLAGRVLGCSSFAPQEREKLRNAAEVFGSAEVLSDLEKWAEENNASELSYPLSAYLKVVDSRLRQAAPKKEKNQDVIRIGAEAFRLTRHTPLDYKVIELLEHYSVDEIIASFQEYVNGLSEKEIGYAVKNFFNFGGADAVILARRKIAEENKPITITPELRAYLDNQDKKHREEIDRILSQPAEPFNEDI
jgi:hypothetical protein